MAKRKKPARKAPKAATPAAEPVAVQTGRKFATVKTVTLPVLALKIEAPAYVTFRAEPREGSAAHMGAPELPSLAEVMDLDSKAVVDLEMPGKLRAIFANNYSSGVKGKSFCIVRHAAHARKNEYGYTVEEIDPNQPADPAPAS